MTILGNSIPLTLIDDNGNPRKGVLLDVTASGYTGTIATDPNSGNFRLMGLPLADYLVTDPATNRSVVVPVFATPDEIDDMLTEAQDAATLAQDAATQAQAATDAVTAATDAVAAETVRATAAEAQKQHIDADLTAIAALDSTQTGVVASDGSGWIRKTYTALKTSLGLVKADVGLGSVDNTSDANKPVSTATQTALNGKQPLNSDLTTVAGLTPINDDFLQRKAGAWTNRTPAQAKTDLGLVKADVGLGNVDNTSDANKPISTTAQTALDGKQPLDSDLTAIAALSTTSFGRALLALADAAALRSAAALGTASGADTTDFDVAGAAAAAQAASQPLDTDLTAIAALSTTAYGRAFLALADAAAARTALGLGTAALSATSAFDAAGAAAAAAAASQPIDSDLTAIAALSTTSYGRAFLALADAAAARTALGLGSAALAASADFDAAGAAAAAQAAAQAASQPLDSDLTAVAALTTTTFGRALLTQADASALRTTAALGSAATHADTDYEHIANKGAASGYMALDSGSRGSQSPKLHAADHQTGGADALLSVGTTTQLAALDPTTVPLGYEFLVTNDSTWGYVRYFALGSPHTWVAVSVLNQKTQPELASLSITATSTTGDNTSNTVPTSVGSPLTFTAEGGNYRVKCYIPTLGSSVASTRAFACIFDGSTQIASTTTSPTVTTLANGPAGLIISDVITGVTAGTSKSYQLASLRSAENTTGTNRVGSKASATNVNAQPIVLWAERCS